MPELDRPARSVPDARVIGDDLAEVFTVSRTTVHCTLQRTPEE